MRPRNVILSLFLVLALLVFGFMKVRFWEPKKKLAFRRNPSRIEYKELALCRMDCHQVSANDITEIIRKGEIDYSSSDLRDKKNPIFVIQGYTKRRFYIRVIILQFGTVAKVVNCINLKQDFDCHCPGEDEMGLQKISKRSFHEFFLSRIALLR